MRELNQITRELRRGDCRIEDFFLLVCPNVTQRNVEEICRGIPAELQLSFRRLVAYQKPSGQIYSVGSPHSEALGQDFFDGLKVLREFFAAQGTLQFGDFLLMEKDRVESLLLRLERSGDLVNQATRNDVSEEKVLIDSLLERHKPVVLEASLPSHSVDEN